MTTAVRAGVAVLLVYGLRVPVPRDDHPGFRLTVQPDGAVWVEPVGYRSLADAAQAELELEADCLTLGLNVSSNPFGFTVSRRS